MNHQDPFSSAQWKSSSRIFAERDKKFSHYRCKKKEEKTIIIIIYNHHHIYKILTHSTVTLRTVQYLCLRGGVRRTNITYTVS